MIGNYNNLIPKENYKKVEEVRFWDYEIKISPLSISARSKVIDRSRSGYVSKNKEDYGPCIIDGQLNYDNCHCSSDELDRQLKIIRNKRELEALEKEKREDEKKRLEKEWEERIEELKRADEEASRKHEEKMRKLREQHSKK